MKPYMLNETKQMFLIVIVISKRKQIQPFFAGIYCGMPDNAIVIIPNFMLLLTLYCLVVHGRLASR